MILIINIKKKNHKKYYDRQNFVIKNILIT